MKNTTKKKTFSSAYIQLVNQNFLHFYWSFSNLFCFSFPLDFLDMGQLFFICYIFEPIGHFPSHTPIFHHLLIQVEVQKLRLYCDPNQSERETACEIFSVVRPLLCCHLRCSGHSLYHESNLHCFSFVPSLMLHRMMKG